jgi:hypothetical protein
VLLWGSRIEEFPQQSRPDESAAQHAGAYELLTSLVVFGSPISLVVFGSPLSTIWGHRGSVGCNAR